MKLTQEQIESRLLHTAQTTSLKILNSRELGEVAPVVLVVGPYNSEADKHELDVLPIMRGDTLETAREATRRLLHGLMTNPEVSCFCTVNEVWTATSSKEEYDAVMDGRAELIPPSERSDKSEALVISLFNKTGRVKTVMLPFKREGGKATHDSKWIGENEVSRFEHTGEMGSVFPS